MGRTKKGKNTAPDLWNKAGGIDVVIKAFVAHGFGEPQSQPTIKSETWAYLARHLFNEDTHTKRTWLKVVWTQDRRGIQGKVVSQHKIEKRGRKEKKEEESSREVTEDKTQTDTDKEMQEVRRRAKQDDRGSNNSVHGSTDITDNTTAVTEGKEGSGSFDSVDGSSASIDGGTYLKDDKTTAETEGQENRGSSDSVEFRATRPGPDFFQIRIRRKDWNKIKPLPGSTKLRPPWTEVLSKEFMEINPCCTLSFKYQHVKPENSRKRFSPFLHASAVCTFKRCKAQYMFRLKQIPIDIYRKISINVVRHGEVTHPKNEKKFRPASYRRRGKIARAIEKGVSNYHYQQLAKTPIEEISAGNFTRSLTKDVLKMISSEVRKSTRLHDDVLLELMLTQKIMKELGSSTNISSGGYIQHLQVDPFGVHMYMDEGLGILVEHLKKASPVTLHLDATGSVVSKIPNQNKKVLYYALVLPGKGKDKPPLPISELLSNEHSIPTLSYWLMETVRKITKCTSRRVRQVETDYSWALMNSVLLSFNKESISAYLDRAHHIIAMQMTRTDLQKFTLLHLCSAHILKAVSHGFGKRTQDKGLKEYATHCFAVLLNSTSMDEALGIFQHMCVLFSAKEDSVLVQRAKDSLDKSITHDKDITIEDVEDEAKDEYKGQTTHNTKTISGQSPFTRDFKTVLQQATCQIKSEPETGIENDYACPGVLDVLFEHYLGIFPLWSGILLGDISRYAKDNVNQETMDTPTTDTPKTRETNCQVELWFWIVKNSILQKKKYLRPADFIHKMYGSLQGRYKAHIIQNNLPESVIPEKLPPSIKSLDQAEEQWGKRAKNEGPKKRRSKYFDPPKKMPKAKKPNRKSKVQDRGREKKLTRVSKETCPKDATRSTLQDRDMQKNTAGNEASKGTHHKDAKGSMSESSKDVAAKIQALWKTDDTEVVVAVIQSSSKRASYILHHSELKTLKPHNWLVGEAIECFFQVAVTSRGHGQNIYVLNHYSSGVIMNGNREEVRRQSLPKVNFAGYSAVISFVNCKNNHWKFLYLHEPTSQVFLVDPAGQDEKKESEQAASRFSEYFKMRRTCHSKSDWVDKKWKGGVINHTRQKDSYSCGVLVMQMAVEVLENHPNVPKDMNFDPSKTVMSIKRREMAAEILENSVFDEESQCSMCASDKPPGGGPTTVWIECDSCKRWFHQLCLGMTTPILKEVKRTRWHCPLCS